MTDNAIHEVGIAVLDRSDFELGIDAERILRAFFHTELAPDRFLPSGHDYRRRAYRCLELDARTQQTFLAPRDTTYMQPVEMNPLAGGVERSFVSIPDDHEVWRPLQHIIDTVVSRLSRSADWSALHDERCRLDVHLIRITAPGKPCPEGPHRDGLIAGSVHVIERTNVTGGTTTFRSTRSDEKRTMVLTDFMDSVIFDDRTVSHYTSPIERDLADRHGHRDVVLLGLRQVD